MLKQEKGAEEEKNFERKTRRGVRLPCGGVEPSFNMRDSAEGTKVCKNDVSNSGQHKKKEFLREKKKLSRKKKTLVQAQHIVGGEGNRLHRLQMFVSGSCDVQEKRETGVGGGFRKGIEKKKSGNGIAYVKTYTGSPGLLEGGKGTSIPLRPEAVKEGLQKKVQRKKGTFRKEGPCVRDHSTRGEKK